MKYLLFIAGLISSSFLFANDRPFEIKEGYAVIHGKVENTTDKFWEFAQTGYFNNSSVSVPIEENGSFYKKVKVEGDAMDLYLYLNDDAITIYIQENDTIEINWDANNFEKTFTVTSTNKLRNQDLQTMLLLYKNHRKEYLGLRRTIYQEKPADSVKFSMINELFNKELETLSSVQKLNAAGMNKMATDIYFTYTSLLSSNQLLSRYELRVSDHVEHFKNVEIFRTPKAYKIQSEYAFHSSASYRQFLFDYIRFERPINGSSLMGNQLEKESKRAPFNPTKKDYHMALANFDVYEIRDWFISSTIMLGFQYLSFEDAEKVYHDFKMDVKVQAYADTLDAFYANIKRLRPGNKAPEIKLKNDQGKLVSLTDLKGKVVYIDFWGVGCGPCIYEIKNSVPELKEKYKSEEVVFLNICVDSNEERWKKSLSELNLGGVNLIAEGWSRNPVCQAYGVKGIPHYVLIDENGIIANYNAPRPSEKGMLYDEIDALLGKK